MNWMNRVALAGLLIAFVLTTLVPTNAAAQQSINFGTHSGIGLNLLFPITLNDDTATTDDDKTYYFVDDDNNGSASGGDLAPHNFLDDLLNGGADTEDTQDGNHDGSDDARSVIISRYTLVLPTLAEMETLRADQGGQQPPGWVNSYYRTATRFGDNVHNIIFLTGTDITDSADNLSAAAIAFQVIEGPSQLSFPTIDNQIYLNSEFVSVTLDAAIAPVAVSPLTYTLTPSTNIPDGMSFNPDTRVLSGTPTTDGIAMLTYTVTDAVGDTASQDFTATVLTPGARPDELLLGTRNGVNLNLRFPVTTADDKTYYYLDEDNSGSASIDDRLQHQNDLRNLLNNGNRVINTQGGNHNGNDDQRSIVIGRYTLVLPNVAELQALRAGLTTRPPSNWLDSSYATSDVSGNGRHLTYNFRNRSSSGSDQAPNFIAFQVITRGSSLSLDIDDQIFLSPRNTEFTLPAATDTGAIAPLTYTLTPHANIPDGMSFDPDTRVLSGFPTTDGVTRLTYSVIDATGDIASQEFTVTVFTPGVRQDALNFGTVSDINLNLIFPVTTKDGKVYYYLDGNNDGISSDGNIISGDGDRIAHAEGGSSLNDLRHLLNHGNPVMETYPDGHPGNDDIRSVHVSIGTAGTITYALILPNLSELVRLRRDQGFSAPPNWSTDLRYHSANQNRAYNLDTGRTANISPSIRRFVAFQVISLPAPPTSVTVTPGNGRFIVNWTPVPADNDGGAAITGYRVLIARSDGGGFIARPIVDGADANSRILTNLTNGIEYRVVINSINSRGNGIASIPVFATPVPVPFVTITNDAAANTANIADGDITFTFEWNEDVTGFTADDISVTGVSRNPSFATVSNMTYTLVVTPDANTNDGIITITVAADAVTGISTGLRNIIHTYTLNYDTEVPDNPTFTTPVTVDNIINIAERDAGVALSGSLTAETGATAVLCFSGGSGEACTGGTLRDATVNGAAWNYTLTTDDINAMGQGDEILTVTVMDAAGNPSTDVSHTINVDTTVPGIPEVCSFGGSTCSDGNNTINAADRAAGITLFGTRANVATDSIIVCLSNNPDITGINCNGGMPYDADINGGDWSLALSEADLTPYGQGVFRVSAIAVDSAGNRNQSGNMLFNVDTIPPPAPTIDVVAEDDIINAAERSPGPVEITGGGSEAEAIVIVRFAGDDATCGSGTISQTVGTGNTWMLALSNFLYMTIGEGSEILCVTATDAASNVSGFATRRISVDTVLPVFPIPNTATTRETVFVGIGSSTNTEIYNAEATDNGRAADIGISYTVGDIGADLFTIDEDSGVLTPLARFSTVPATHDVNIVATDEAGNAATQYLSVVVADVPTVTFTNDAAGPIANIVDGGLAFTAVWSEAVSGFATGDLDVRGGGFSGIPSAQTMAEGRIYTFTSSPSRDTNDGVLTITVAAGAVNPTATGRTGLTNIETIFRQAYDTSSPSAPTIVTPVTKDNIINLAERSTGVALSGSLTAETGATAVLCFSGGSGETCTGGTLRDAAVNGAVWSYTLSAADVDAMGQGKEILTITVMDAAGNPSADVSHTINVDTSLPVTPGICFFGGDMCSTGDNIINAAERAAGVTLTGTRAPVDTDSLIICINDGRNSANINCSGGGDSYNPVIVGGDWSLTLSESQLTPYGEGEFTVNAIAIDLAGNPSISRNRRLEVDTIPPATPTIDVVAGDDIINAAERASGSVEITGGNRETGATVTLRFAGDDATCDSGSIFNIGGNGSDWSFLLEDEHYEAMGEGPEILCVTATDAAGNVSDPATRRISVDTVFPVFPIPNTTATMRETVFAGIGSSTNTEIYNTEATDNGRAADIGISYTVGDIGADLFTIDEDSGVLTPLARLSTVPATHDVNIVATDEAGNAATQYLSVVVADVPTVTITSDAAGLIANIADGDLTFTFTFSEEVMGFVTGDITVTGGNASAFSGDDPGTLYTLVVTPTPNNAGTITVTVAAGAATATVGNSRTNLGASEMQAYDTQAPTMPSIDEPITSEDNFINAAEATAGVSLTGGGVEMGGSVTLCLPDGRGTSCGTDRTLRVANVTGTGWSYTLTAADITAMGQGDERLTVIANDAAGNPSTVTTRDITIDTVAPNAPAITTPIAVDDFINAAEQTSGFTVAVTSSSDTAAVDLCLGETLPADTACGGTLHIATGGPTTWSYTLTANNLSGLAEGVLTLTAIASDAVGNMAVSAARTVTVDTIPPPVPSTDVVAGDDIINAAERASGSVEITGGNRETGATVTLRFAGGDDTCDSGSIFNIGGNGSDWSFLLEDEHYEAMGEGPEILCVTATDAAGNVSNPATRRISVDTVFPVFPIPNTTATTRETVFAGTGSSTNTEIYNTEASDNGRAADIGISYTVGDIGADLFTIDEDSGVLTPRARLSTVPATHDVNIVATDEAGNPSTYYLTVDINEITMVTITDNVAAVTANIADGDITFIFEWGEVVTGFTAADISVTGGSRNPLVTTAVGMTYTLVVTPNANTNDGIIIITVASNAVTSTATNLGNIIQRYTQNYDTGVPDNPTFTTPVTVDNIINAAEATAGVSLTGGGVEMGGSVTLCFAGRSGTSCGTGLTLRDVTVDGTGWSYTLTAADITAMGQGDETLTVIANDAAGNPSPGISHDINVDTVLPVFPMPNPTTMRETVFVGIGSSTNTEIYNTEASDNGRAADIGISYTVGDIGADLFTIDEDSGVLTPQAQLSAVPTTHDVNIVATDEAGNPSTYFLTVGIVAAGISIHDLRAGGNEISMVTIADEDGGTSTFYVQLTSAPQTGSPVVIDVVSSDTREGTVTTPSLTFSDTTWNARQEIIVTAIDDSKDGNDSFTVDFNISAGDGNLYLTTLNLPSVVVTVTNDDIALFFRIKVFLEGAQ